ncbi:alpha/beta hydrolase [Nocardia stercoris]|uniref:Alpha/beta hydrolase n=2 Tax=Nocardia stercoris TaxID=2483361 RepID=A0A3M2KQW2_9NOCA|nr:alpha/beta hydrolase [Nocardia stercoris]
MRSGRVAALVALACVAAACTTSGKPTPTQTGAAAAGMDKFYSQTVKWGSCDTYPTDSKLPAGTECTRVDVPVDYAKPGGATAQIALSRVKATGQKIGSLLFNPGGPGEGGLWMVGQGNGTPIAERFDRVGFDPRGIGASVPLIHCLSDKESDAFRAEPPHDNSPAGIAATESEAKQVAGECTKNTGNEFLSHVGTREVAQDMDIIRAALGDDKLNYVGFSYGTRLGTAYAEKFPTKVRAMVLDGAVDPNGDPLSDSINQATGFQKAFEAYAADCATKPDCPLGTDPAQAVNRFHDLIWPLWDHPSVAKDGRVVTIGDATTGVQAALYGEDGWPILTQALNQLQHGSGDLLMRLADNYDGRGPDGTYTNSQDAFNAIHCVDDPPITDQATIDRQDAEYRKAAPFLDDNHAGAHAPHPLCNFWPVPSTGGPHKIDGIAGLPTIVVVSTTGDPATPYQSGVNLANDLKAALITNTGTRHTAYLGGVQCVDDAVNAYLIDLTIPPAGLTCG